MLEGEYRHALVTMTEAQVCYSQTSNRRRNAGEGEEPKVVRFGVMKTACDYSQSYSIICT